MKINRITYKAYGKIIDKSFDTSNHINVIYGENEAGKSTIFNSISSLIYGFKPLSKEKHLYTSWEKDEINFECEINVDSELYLVHRRLRSVPKLSIINLGNDQISAFRNEELPWIPNVSESLFHSVFHLTAEDLNQMENESWDSIQEKLIFNFGSDYLNKTSDVMSKIEQDIGAIWRRDRRGNPLMNVKQSELSSLKKKKIEAEIEYEKMVKINVKIETLTHEISRFDETVIEIENENKSIRSLLPIKIKEQRINHLKKQIVNDDYFINMDRNILDKYYNYIDISKSLSEHIKEIDRKIILSQNELYMFNDDENKLMTLKNSVERLKHLEDCLKANEQLDHTLSNDQLKLSDKILFQYTLLFNLPWQENNKALIMEISPYSVKTVVQKHIESRKNYYQFESNQHFANKKNNMLNIFTLVISAAFLVVGIVFKPIGFLSYLGMMGLGFAGSKLFKKQNTSEQMSVNTMELENEIKKQMNGLNIPPYAIEDTSYMFFIKLEQLITLCLEEDLIIKKREETQHIKHKLELETKTYFDQINLDCLRGIYLTLQIALAQIEKLEHISREEEKKHYAIENLKTKHKELIDSANQIGENIDAINQKFQMFSENSVESGIQSFINNHAILDKIKVINEEMNLEIEQLPINLSYQTSIILDESILDKNALMLSNIQNAKQNAALERNSLLNEVQNIRKSVQLEEILSQILVLEDELNDLIDLRNTNLILLELIKHADDQFRIENQPDIISKVSQYLKCMTNNKYKEVLIVENGGQFELQVLVDHEILPLSKAFSKGTINQLFFAFRLAVIQAIDPQNVLPILLDEALINWDSKRLNATFELLSEISKTRQIFIFTCHPWFLDKLKAIDDINEIHI